MSTGCGGLDQVLGGGLVSGQFYLLQGEPGSGKTTLARHLAAHIEGEVKFAEEQAAFRARVESDLKG